MKRTLTSNDPMPWDGIALGEKKKPKLVRDHVRSELARSLCQNYPNLEVVCPCPRGDDHPLWMSADCRRSDSLRLGCLFGHGHDYLIDAIAERLQRTRS